MSRPKGSTAEMADKLVASKSAWIYKSLRDINAMNASRVSREWANGESIDVFGRPMRLSIVQGQGADLLEDYENQRLCLSLEALDNGRARLAVINFLSTKLTDYVATQIGLYEKSLDVKVNSLEIRDLNKDWGRCNHRHDIKLNWKLAMAPLTAIRYVLLCEAAHCLSVQNSAEFWAYVEAMMPNYKTAKNWLKMNGAGLTLPD